MNETQTLCSELKSAQCSDGVNVMRQARADVFWMLFLFFWHIFLCYNIPGHSTVLASSISRPGADGILDLEHTGRHSVIFTL